MARADLLVTLVRAASSGDKQLVRRAVEALVAEERAKNHHVLADQLASNLVVREAGGREPARLQATEAIDGLLREVSPALRLDDLVLPEDVRTALDELVEEQHRVELLRSHGMEPRSKLLLAGPPGNGKTSVAHALAEALLLPLYVVRYEGVVGSYLGETAKRLQRVFDFARQRRCVLLLDEFETVGKERGDEHETGEMKRVVSSLLLDIDALPSHVVVVAATNHQELLDRAAWRRFDLRLELPMPSRKQIARWFERFVELHGGLGLAPRTFADRLHGACFADIEALALDIRRRAVLAAPGGDVAQIAKTRLALHARAIGHGGESNGDGG